MTSIADINSLNGLLPLAAQLHPPWTEDIVCDVLSKSNADVSVYTDGTDLLGFICIEYVEDEGCITAIVVAKNARRRGIGQSLISFAENLRYKSNIYLEVDETNTAAAALYAKCGYISVGKRKNYYGKNAAIIMNKEF